MSGGSGYVLTREAVRRLVEIALDNPDVCDQHDKEMEDIEIGKCLENVNVTAPDTRDSHLRARFLPLGPVNHLNPNMDPNYWYWKYRFYEADNDVSNNGNE